MDPTLALLGQLPRAQMTSPTSGKYRALCWGPGASCANRVSMQVGSQPPKGSWVQTGEPQSVGVSLLV